MDLVLCEQLPLCSVYLAGLIGGTGVVVEVCVYVCMCCPLLDLISKQIFRRFLFGFFVVVFCFEGKEKGERNFRKDCIYFFCY